MSEHQITLKQLMRIADNTPWEQFEAMTDGRLLLKDCAQTMLAEEEDVNPLLWLFEMRVGLHFERPMQAIMSCGHFIRMRSAERWKNFSLNKLDPCHPSGCLYWHSTPPDVIGPSAYGWQPIEDLSYSQALQQLNVYNQQSLQSQLTGCTVTYTNNTLATQPYSVGLASGSRCSWHNNVIGALCGL